MATKKTAETELNKEETEAAKAANAEEKAQTPADPWDEKVKMYVPRKQRGDDQSYFVCINDRKYMVPANGREQELPRPVAEVLQQSLDAENKYQETLDQINAKTAESRAAL